MQVQAVQEVQVAPVVQEATQVAQEDPAVLVVREAQAVQVVSLFYDVVLEMKAF